MNDYVKLYTVIRKADELTGSKGWVYLLYYPLMKELDSMRRHLLNHPAEPYDRTLVDGFYFGFGLYDSQLPAIGLDDFRRILDDTTTFIPSPLKRSVPLTKELRIDDAITNFHDASPCFISKDQSFRVIVDATSDMVDKDERKKIIEFIIKTIFDQDLCDIRLEALFRSILTDYVHLAANKFQGMIGWLDAVANSDITLVVTDQTLAPAQCCVNHYLKAKGKHIVTLQHQKNMLLTDIFPLVYLDLSLSDVYHTWFSPDSIEKNYGDYLPYFKTKIVQTGAVKPPIFDCMGVLSIIENSTTCLLILNSVDDKYVQGTMNSPYHYEERIGGIIEQLRSACYEVYIRTDPRSSFVIENVDHDKSDSLTNAIHKYDVCICDRPGGAAVEVLEEKGFVFIHFDQSEFRKTPKYVELEEKGRHLKRKRTKGTGLLDLDFDLLMTC